MARIVMAGWTSSIYLVVRLSILLAVLILVKIWTYKVIHWSICSRYHWLTIKKRLASMICSIDAVRLIKSSIFCILDLARAFERVQTSIHPSFKPRCTWRGWRLRALAPVTETVFHHLQSRDHHPPPASWTLIRRFAMVSTKCIYTYTPDYTPEYVLVSYFGDSVLSETTWADAASTKKIDKKDW